MTATSPRFSDSGRRRRGVMIACGNVANLFLVRASGTIRSPCGRHSGQAVRITRAPNGKHGAGAAGGAVGVALAQAATGLLRTIVPASYRASTRLASTRPSSSFAFGVSILAASRSAWCRPPIRLPGISELSGEAAWRDSATPHAQWTGGRPGRAGADAADRIGPDDSNVPGDATGRPWVCASGGGPDVRRRNPGELHRRS
jgi:hypothetical protein